jgi:sigma-B regulation protein RsbU (phosphoserine phosphatase)
MAPDLSHLTAGRLSADLMMVIGATVLASLAMGAIALFSLRRRASDRVLLSFTAFVALYAMRLFATTDVVPRIVGGSELFWRYLIFTVTYVIQVPLLLFAEQLLGPGTPPIRRIVRQIAIVFALVAVVGSIVSGRPEWAVPANNAFVLLLIALLVPAILMPMMATSREELPARRALLAGGSIAAAFVLAENLRNFTVLSWWPSNVEFIGLIALALSLAYAVTERFLGQEGRLAAIDRELDTARRIQHSILPRAVPLVDGVRLHVRYLPMTAVAGDFYEFFQSPCEGDTAASGAGTVGVLVADVSGHGVPAALIASMVKVAATSHREEIGDPGRVLTQMNRTLDGQLGGQFVTMMCAQVDRRAGTVVYAGAGHPPILHWRAASRTLEKLASTGFMVGPFPDAVYTTGREAVAPGDRLAIYTDGLLEAFNAGDEMFGDARFPALFREHADLPGDAFADLVLRELTQWSGKTGGLDDDVTLVIVDVR